MVVVDDDRLDRIEDELARARTWRVFAWVWAVIVAAAVVFGLVVWRLATV